MSKTFQRIYEGELVDQLAHAMREWHPILHACGVEIVVLEVRSYASDGHAQPALKHGGYTALATIKIQSSKNRALGLGDALLSYDGNAWEDLSEEEQLAALDHELTHLEVAGVKGIDEDTGEVLGKIELDSRDRPKLRIRLHDWHLGGFTSVARRHRDDSIEVQAVKSCVDAHGQHYWDWQQAELFAREAS